MKTMKKLVLVGLVLLASVMVLAGCKNDSVPEVPKYTVKFETEHRTAPASITVESGTKLTAEQLKALPDTEDNIFEGWYDGETQAKGGEYTVTKDVTLVARWRNRDTVASVTFSPENGTKFYYGEKVTVSLSSTTGGATIKYKLDDGEWRDYSSPIDIPSQNTITAYAIKEGLKDSEKTSAKYLRELTSISITPPTRTVYSVGEEFAPTDMVVTATYDDESSREVTGWTTDFGVVTSEKGLDKEVTVSYTEGDNTETATFTVDVVDPSVPTILTSYISPNHTDDSWTYVAFGEWPQSEAIGVSPTKVEQHPEGLFNEKYYSDSNGNYVKEGDKYYKVEPIVWRVLTENYLVPDENGQPVESGNSLLLAEKILTGGIPYYVNTSSRTIGNATVYPNNYKYSTIRAWLNGLDVVKSDSENDSTYKDKGFLQTAFTTSAQNLIEETTVDNSKESTFGRGETGGDNPYVCTNTSDKIFLLSEQEATTAGYGFVEYNEYGEGNTRIRVTTDYAQATGAYHSSTDGYGGWWWLRSPLYDDERHARFIYDDGDAYGSFIVSDIEMGVVPALSISMNGN
ncbi:MAG: InlB B-repeat-containing protein [Treponema sp.]|nr:InlB B-repeat-containing protein [Treponema sp.]